MPVKRAARRGTAAGAEKNCEAEREAEQRKILARYWDLANLDPEITKGNISGQLKALDSLFEFHFAPTQETKPEPHSQTQGPGENGTADGARPIYRAAWMHPSEGAARRRPPSREQ